MIAWIAARWASKFELAAYAWVPAVVLFTFAAADSVRSWSPSWSSIGRWEYFTNTMFGPDMPHFGMRLSSLHHGGADRSGGVFSLWDGLSGDAVPNGPFRDSFRQRRFPAPNAAFPKAKGANLREKVGVATVLPVIASRQWAINVTWTALPFRAGSQTLSTQT